MKNIFQIIMLVTLFLTSCVATKPDSQSVSRPDYNGRVKITDPHYIKRTTPIGYAAVVAGTAGGAYLGYKSELVQSQNGEFRKPNNLANAAIGALLGFATTSLVNQLMGHNQRINIDTPDKWLTKANKDYLLYSDNGFSGITAIPKSLERSYSVKNMEDVKGFYSAFPYSRLKGEKFKEAVSVVQRDDLPALVSLDPKAGAVEDAKLRFYKTSNSVSQLLNAKNTFPKTSYPILEEGVRLTSSYNDAIRMLDVFPDMNQKKPLFINSLQSSYVEREAIKMKSRIGVENYFLKNSDFTKNSSIRQKNYIQALLFSERPTNFVELTKLFQQNNWLTFPEKPSFMLGQFWNELYDDFPDGNHLVGRIFSIVSDPRLADLKISRVDANKFIQGVLEKEISKHIFITSGKTLSTRNDNLDTWKSSIFYDAPYIKSTGDIRYLHYGKVKNNSKFDLPVTLIVNGILIKETEVDFLNLISASVQKERVSSGTKEFHVPLIKKGEEQDYAVMFDFGKGTQSEGINILGVQSNYELKMESFSYQKSYFEGKLSQTDKKKQKLWMDLVNKGLPKAAIQDVINWGYKEYAPDSYTIDLSDVDWSDYSEYSYDDYDLKRQEEKERKAKEEKNDCMKKYLDEFEYDGQRDDILFGHCSPCNVYRIPGFFGSSLVYLAKDDRGKWWYGGETFQLTDRGPYETKEEAISKNLCQD